MPKPTESVSQESALSPTPGLEVNESKDCVIVAQVESSKVFITEGGAADTLKHAKRFTRSEAERALKIVKQRYKDCGIQHLRE